MKLLFDENLSPTVAPALAIEDGIDACHVRDRAGLGWEDPEVFERAFKEDRIVVTCNVNDAAPVSGRSGHPGACPFLTNLDIRTMVLPVGIPPEVER